MLDIRTVFKRAFGFTPPQVVQAPGRLELLGNHTDYNEGLVMALAINKTIAMAASPRNDGRIELVSSAFPERDSFTLSVLEKNPATPWTNYVKGVLRQLRQHGVHFGGFNAAVHGTIPMGAGLSSSAALEVATALTVRQLHPYTLTATGAIVPPQRDRRGQLPPLTAAEKLGLARLCQAAENQFVGVQCGLLDQISSLFGKAFHVIQIDCRDVTVELTPMVGEVGVIMCHSGVNHALVGSAYNELRGQCEAAARALGVRSLRQVEPRQLAANKAKLSVREYECAYHILGENQRVVFADRALRVGDVEQFGHYLSQSHESSRDFFRNSCPELDLLVDLARRHPGCLGARLTGGGFGGATINLVRQAGMEDFCHSMLTQYQRRTGHDPAPSLCQIVDGAH
jgi:galactokinase